MIKQSILIVAILVVVNNVCADTQVCKKYPMYCGPYIDLAECKKCCAQEFSAKQDECAHWCFSGIIK